MHPSLRVLFFEYLLYESSSSSIYEYNSSSIFEYILRVFTSDIYREDEQNSAITQHQPPCYINNNATMGFPSPVTRQLKQQEPTWNFAITLADTSTDKRGDYKVRYLSLKKIVL